ncbi:MAG: 30S ribosomal protein S9 [Dehalococcoidia bacterium]|jgi:small subunit ribosomal protein S9
MDKQNYFYGTGRRKESVARVRVMNGKGAIIINGTPYEERFPSLEHQRLITQPLLVTESLNKYNVVAKVEGGGVTGQSGAIAHGISRALVKADERYKPILRQNGLLTRDPRTKERKKPGLRRARKAPQYTKR